ncbi:hypothetical protein [Aeoliella mucimassa]|uniref:SLA1 homology domain-containing protein n=1 Tax=Aeoliella mucimassa TaxID=2527972 RepID=A0A518ASY7_9BACT|nr:hypothetical protein [Aeoliella mucimassa]QDU57841.1 hypothetical protein Pan181_40640 [Aeoliella mucimassa]
MRELPLFLLTLFSLCNALQLAHAEPLEQPYRVWVGDSGAKIYSYASDDNYPTQQVPVGTECEVYEELRDGWLAIRPPAGSHSLVLRSALQFDTDGQVARVKRDSTPCRVGSVMSDSMSSVQVRLDAGELVQVIDDGKATGSQWATIAPPAGEFRYVRERDVLHSEPRVDLNRTTNTAATQGEPTVAIPADNEVVRVSNDELAPLEGFSTGPNTTTTPQSPPAPATPQGFAAEMDRLEIQLSRRMSGPVNLWVFDDLEREAAAMLSRATSPAEQQAITNLASRMNRFAAISQQSRTASTAATTPAATPQTPPTTLSNDVTPIAGNAAADPALAKYDAVGVLRPVVSTKGNAPPYALVDDAGNVVTFITPSPSLNLQSLLGQRVGVSGTRGYLPQYGNRNIQTADVSVVEGTMRR